MQSVKQGGIRYHFLSLLVWLDLELNSGLPDHWQMLYPLGQWAGYFINLNQFICWWYIIQKEIWTFSPRNLNFWHTTLFLNFTNIFFFLHLSQIFIFLEISCIIIIMSRRLRGYPWPSLAISPYHSSPPAGLQDYNPCPHIAAARKFVLVVPLLHIHEWGSTGVHRLWARPCFSSSVLRVWFVELV